MITPTARVAACCLLATALVLQPAAPAGAAPAAATVEQDSATSASLFRLYRAFFVRDPDGDGHYFWMTRARAGESLGAVAEEFTRSTEFTSTYGSLSDDDFLDLVYQNVMGRPADADGKRYWGDRIDEGMSRGDVMLWFSDSAEFREVTKTGAGSPPWAPPDTYTLAKDDRFDTPMRWEPCATVTVLVNPANMEAGAETHIREALTTIAAATRTSYAWGGQTDWVPTEESPYPPKHTTVFLWDRTKRGQVQYGRDSRDGQTQRYVSSYIYEGWQPQAYDRRHALLSLAINAGLGPVDAARGQLLNGGRVLSLQYGDLAGLARVGDWQSDCNGSRTADGTDSR